MPVTLLPLRNTLAHKAQNPPLFGGSTLFEPNNVLAPGKGASMICSAAPRVSLTPQLGREVRMLMANSPPGTSIGPEKGPVQRGPAWVTDSGEQVALRPI